MKKILNLILVLILAVVASLGFIYKDEILNKVGFENKKVEQKVVDDNKPKVRDNIIGVKQPYPFIIDAKGINNDLKQFANESLAGQFIYLNKENLPEAQQKLLVNNKDVYSYILGYLTGERVPFEYGETATLNRKYPYYLQWDRRWAYNELGRDSIAIGGCGPTVVSMAIGGLLNDNTITPNKIADIENKNGYYTPFGTSWNFFDFIAKQYGLTCRNITISKKSIDATINKGNPIIVSVKPGKFTTVGHIILIAGMDEQGNYIINDPNSYTRTLKKWTYDELKTEIKSLWEFSK